MIRFMVVMVAVVFLIVGLTKHNWVEALLFGLSVAVGLTPEMLPMIVTVNLSKGALAMSRKKVIVKRLNSIQNFGAMDILCTDKTGTLTQDRVVLERYVDVTNRESEDVLRYAYMNSYYQTGLRNLLDRAVLAHTDLDVERTCRKVDEIPFDFSAPAHVGRHRLRRRPRAHLQGRGGGDLQRLRPLPGRRRDPSADRHAQERPAGGVRGLERATATACWPSPTGNSRRRKEVFSVADESDLILLGYIAFFDPPKDSAGRGHGGPAQGRRGDQDPDRRQRAGHPESLPRRGPGDRQASSPATSCAGSSDEQLADAGGEDHRLRAPVPVAEGADHPGPAARRATWWGSWATASTTRPR